jgi:hypothetical protein
MMVRYATLAYGKHEAVFRQASMLLVSLLAHAPRPFEIIVVTDRPDRFAWFADVIKVRVLTPGELQGWIGPEPFSMRQKLEAASAVMPRDGALAFLDADVVARDDLTPFVAALGAGGLVMHKREFELGASTRAGNRQLWANLEGRTFATWQYLPTDGMWNSGVLALPAADARLLRDALELYDAMGAAGVRHFATEQLAVGLVLGRTGRLRSAEAWFLHYWGNKASFDHEIARRLDEWHRRRTTPTAAAESWRAEPIQLPAEVRPDKIEKIRRWFRKSR